MSWRDELLGASFRGVAFEVKRASKDAQQKNAVHEYPDSDRVEVEPLGAGARRFTIEGFVIGAEYMAARDRLEQALDLPGPGELVHPYRGRLDLVVENYGTEEGADEGGWARFTIAFIKSDPPGLPAAGADTQALVLKAADAAAVEAAADFAEGSAALTDGSASDLAKESRFAAMVGQVRAVAGRIRAAIKGAKALVTNIVRAVLNPLASVRAFLFDLVSLPGDFVNLFRSLASQLTSVLDLSTLFNDSDEVAASAAVGLQPDPVLTQFVRAVLVAREAEIVAQTPFVSYPDAIAARDQLIDRLDRVAETASDRLFVALQDLRVAVTRDIEARGADLARIARYTPGEVLPALVIAHRLYGPLEVVARAEEIVSRNRIEHPGFVRGGVPIEVLTE